MTLPFALNHINLWLLDDGEGVAIVDTGYDIDSTREAWDAILGRLGKPVTRIIVTHCHPDHLGLAQWLAERTGAQVSMSLGEFLAATPSGTPCPATTRPTWWPSSAATASTRRAARPSSAAATPTGAACPRCPPATGASTAATASSSAGANGR
jgi:glyoxylase-like metal-dependent hydrolase (beta-lactamase superfamily II)